MAEVWGRTGVPVRQGYGLSETSPGVTVQVVEEFWRFAGSVRGLLPNVWAKIVGEDGEEVRDGDVSGTLASVLLWSSLTNIKVGR